MNEKTKKGKTILKKSKVKKGKKIIDDIFCTKKEKNRMEEDEMKLRNQRKEEA